MRKRIGTVAALILGAGLVMALVGAVVGIHNPITPHVPPGREGAVIGAGLGLILGALLAGVSCWYRKAMARGLGGAVLGGLLGLSFGLRVPGIAVPAGYLGALVGALFGSGFFVLFRSRILLGVVAGVWATGVANPERYAPVTDTSRPLAELPPSRLLGPGADVEISTVDVTPKPVGLIPPAGDKIRMPALSRPVKRSPLRSRTVRCNRTKFTADSILNWLASAGRSARCSCGHASFVPPVKRVSALKQQT